MAKPFIDMQLLGERALIETMTALPMKARNKVLPGALKKSAKRLKLITIQKVSGIPIKPRTGTLLMGMIATAVKKLPKRKDVVGQGVALPERKDVGIGDKDDEYYPAYLEYGYDQIAHGKLVRHIPPKSFARASVDENASRESRQILSDAAQGIKKEWRKLVGLRATARKRRRRRR